jgi:hypothetical protein
MYDAYFLFIRYTVSSVQRDTGSGGELYKLKIKKCAEHLL